MVYSRTNVEDIESSSPTGHEMMIPRKLSGVQFFLDANRVTSKGKLSAMNQLEKWHADGVIRLRSLKMRRAKRSQVGMREQHERPERIGTIVQISSLPYNKKSAANALH
jgi:hypothetical protein